jgi:G:T/U-mismatch repair DNA glycosylase
MKHPYNQQSFEDYKKTKGTEDEPKILIIGTTPPWRFALKQDFKTKNGKLEGKDEDKEIDFYYGSKDNSFWNLVGVQKDFNSIKDHCKKNGWLFMDIVEECCAGLRKKGPSAADESLLHKNYNLNIFNILSDQNHKIKKIFFTSKKSYDFFLTAAVQEKLISKKKDYLDLIPNKLKTSNFDIEIIILPAPSGKHGKVRKLTNEQQTECDEKKMSKEDYRKWVYETLLLNQKI